MDLIPATQTATDKSNPAWSKGVPECQVQQNTQAHTRHTTTVEDLESGLGEGKDAGEFIY